MTTTTDPATDWALLSNQPLTLTLSHRQWEVIRYCCLFSSSDSRHGACDRNLYWSDQAFAAYRALRQEMGLDPV